MPYDIQHRKTKIVCTLGPSSSTYEQIFALAKAGMDVARINFSHGTHPEHQKLIEIVRKISYDISKPIAILQDLQGPKIRVQTFENGQVELKDGQEFILTVRDVVGNNTMVSVSYKSFYKDVKPGDAVLLDDGNLKLEVVDIKGLDVHCRVIYGGVLKDKKGLNLPGSILSVPCLTEKDRRDLEFGMQMDVDYVALSFVQRPEDINEIKWIIESYGKQMPVVAKIEKPQAVEAIDKITDLADAIMVARGDLGVEMPAEEVPSIQKNIIRLCNQKGIPVITATQMLDSMIQNPRPTRAEASDVANAILDGTDAVMLSGETASGAYPIEAVKTMDRIIRYTESQGDTGWRLRRRNDGRVYPIELAIGYCACQAAEMVNAKAIICLTQSGSTAGMISRYRPMLPIIALTWLEETYNKLALLWGVRAFLVSEIFDNMDDAVEKLKNKIMELKLVKEGDTVVFTSGLPFSKRRKTNDLRIEEI
jgi:pyruvate kinase